jgi:hypothetical protein
MHWLEALEAYLNACLRPFGNAKPVTCAVVETTPAPAETQSFCELVGGWLIEARETPRGNIALHLFPSAS